MTIETSRRAVLAGAAAVIPAAIAAPALASVEPVDPAVAAFEKLRGNWTADNLRAAFRLADPRVKKLIYMLSREEELIKDLKTEAKLQKLFAKLEAAHAKWKAYLDGPHAEVSKRFKKLAPPMSEVPPWMRPLPAKIAKQLPPIGGGKKRTDLTGMEVEIIERFAPKHPVLALYKQHCREQSVEWDARRKERNRIFKECGLDRAEKEQERLYDLCFQIYDRIIATRARTTAGLKIKLLAARLMDFDMGADGGAKEWRSIRSDIIAIAPQPAV